MRNIDHIYIDGEFVRTHGTEKMEIVNPATEEVIGQVTLGDVEDARHAVMAAKRAFPAFSKTSKAERIAILRRLHESVLACKDELRDATIAEYGGVVSRASWVSEFAAQSFLDAAATLEGYEFERKVSRSTLVMESVGVCVLVTPWNSNAGSICSKLAMAIAAGCTSVVKPSELSAIQTQIVTEAIHAAGLPRGVVNVVNGRGNSVGQELSTNPDVDRISFTGSTGTGKAIARLAVDTVKRVTLGLSGKSPTIILDDADFETAVPAAIAAAFQNSGQACIAGSRLLVPRRRLPETIELVRDAISKMTVGSPADPTTVIGPMVNRSQFDRIQSSIRTALDEGAEVIVGGLGRPEHTTLGFFVRPTVLANVRNSSRISQDEVFGPVLCLLTFDDEEEAVTIANDSAYGLHAYVFSRDREHAQAVSRRLRVGRVAINGMTHDARAPFGGYKQSGVGREYGVLGLESFLEAKTVMVA